jgi:regulatory protein YycH of two-component signal transduction system YycFG
MCREIAQRKSHCESQSKYSNTDNGKLKRAELEKKRRIRNKNGKMDEIENINSTACQSTQKNVTNCFNIKYNQLVNAIKNVIQKSVDDEGSRFTNKLDNILVDNLKITLSFPNKDIPLSISNTGQCHFCGNYGEIVNKFPRRGYG